MTLTEPFRLLAGRALDHEPMSCTRSPCRRCIDHLQPPRPEMVDHQVSPYVDRSVSPFGPLVPFLRVYAPHVSEELGKAMLGLADAIRDHEHDRWSRLLAWEHRNIGVSLTRHERGDDPQPEQAKSPTISIDEERLRREEARTGQYAQDARLSAAALPPALRDLPTGERQVKNIVLRLRFLVAVAEARQPRRLLSREQTATQVAADGWCKSCYRTGVFEPIDKRPTGEPWYRDLCRWCGSHKGNLPQPPADDVRIHHHLPIHRGHVHAR